MMPKASLLLLLLLYALGTEAGRRGAISTSGSFTMRGGRGNRAGNDESAIELGEAPIIKNGAEVERLNNASSVKAEELDEAPEVQDLEHQLQHSESIQSFPSVLAAQTAYEGYACGGTKTSEFVVENADGTDLCVQLKTGALGSGQSASQSRVCANSTTALWSDLTAGNVESHTFKFNDYEQYTSTSANRGPNGWTLDASSPLSNVWSTGVSMTGSSLTEWDDYDPGCYVNQPAGDCPRRAWINTSGSSMYRDSWGEENLNSGASQSNCEARKARYDTWCGGTESEWVFIAANSTLKWTKARCRVMMKRGNQTTIDYKRNNYLFKAYYNFIKVSACANIFWKYRNGTELVKGQDCGVKKLIDITHYDYKCATVSADCPTGNWTTVHDLNIWVESDVQSFVSQVV